MAARAEKERASWGEINGKRVMMDERNKSICTLYRQGMGIHELMESFNLSEDSIRKIIWKSGRLEDKREMAI